MNCPVCDGALRQQTVNICACDDLPAVIVRNVPASVCTRCEEKVLSQEVLDTFVRIRKGEAPPPTREYSYVYDYDAASFHVTPTDFTGWAQARVFEVAITSSGTSTHEPISSYRARA